jgi:4'-phosphopantetheinyl transferase
MSHNLQLYLWSVRDAPVDMFVESLPLQERHQADGMGDLRRRAQFILGRYLLRQMLALQHGVELPAQLSIAAQGKPMAPGAPDFNIAHSENSIAVAVAAHGAVGVDLQVEQSDRDFSAVIKRYGSPQEISQLAALPAGERAEYFWRFWSAKEAYGKWTGAGLNPELTQLQIAWQDKKLQASPRPCVLVHRRFHLDERRLHLAACAERIQGVRLWQVETALPSIAFIERSDGEFDFYF